MPRQVSSFAALVGLSLALPLALTTDPRSAKAQGSPPPAGSATASTPAASAPAASTPAVTPGAKAPAAAGTAPAGTQPAATSPAGPPPAPTVSAAASGAPPAASPPAPAGSGDEAVDLVTPAPAADPSDNPYIPVHAERRSGFVFGMSGGLVATSASGTRVKYSQRDQVADPGLALGSGGTFYLGGALTDWFTFRLGTGGGSATKNGLLISGGSFLVGVDLWPLFYRGGIFRDLGVGLDFGTGSASIVNEKNELDIRAEGSGFSMIRTSVFYEPRLFWRISGGPALSYEYRSTDTYTEHQFTIGGRITFYGGP